MKPYYEDKSVTIYHGDCREILPNIESAGQLISDPPYGISLAPQRKLTESIQGDGREEAEALLRFALDCLCSKLAVNSAHFIFAEWSETWVQDMLREYFTVKSCIVWRKNMFGIGYHVRPQHEFIYLCHKGKPKPPAVPKSDVWDFSKVRVPVHSCEKPTDLLYCCASYYPDFGTIIDPFCGVGATLRAAKDAGRKAIGIEIEEKYCEIAAMRMAQEVFDFQ